MQADATATILNTYGFHARPSTTFSQIARGFDAEITVEVDGQTADAKSVMELMSLGVEQGREIRIRAEGADAEAAVDALKEHVDDRFGGIE
jgi:phosphotransferase system HPr (HPr) family protein